MLMQQRVKNRPRFGLPAQFQDLQRPQFAQSARDWIAPVFQVSNLFVAHAVGRRASARGQRQPPPSLQLEQQRTRGHVLDLAGEVAPVPDLAQFAREPIPAPIGMGRQQSPHLRQLRRPNGPPLNDQTLIHTPTLQLPPGRVQPQMKLFPACLPASRPSSFPPVKRKDLNSYKQTTKSSTTKGAKALASKRQQRRSQTGKALSGRL